LIPSVLSADVAYPSGRFPFNLEYQLTYQKAVASGDLNLQPPVGPFYCSSMARFLTKSPTMKLVGNTSDSDIRLFSIVTEKFRTGYRSKSEDLFLLTTGLRYQLSQYFGTLALFNLDRAKAIDPEYSGKKWRGLAGDIETAAIYFKKNNFSVTLGRQRVFWGPQPVNLVLSETAEPLDLFSVRYRKGKLRFNFLFARLDESRPDSTDFMRLQGQTFNDNRYLVGHRLDISLFRNLRVGLFETSLFGGEGRPPELYYLNPLQFFHAAQLNENEDDNTILGLDCIWLPWRGYEVYGQLIIDDFQVDSKSQGDEEPDEIGLMCGLFKAGCPAGFSPDLKLEYVKITNRTYHQGQPRNRYLFRNKLLGHPLGPDADSLSLVIRFWPGIRQSIGLELSYSRHGEGSIYSPWDEPWADVEGDYHEPFPTGTVERSFNVALRINGYLPVSRYTSEWLNLSLTWLGFLEVGIME
jgi:hypothetical protein